jgi:hypothetical protein
MKRIANRSGCGNVSMVTARWNGFGRKMATTRRIVWKDCLGLGWSEVGVAHSLMSQFGLKQHFKSS